MLKAEPVIIGKYQNVASESPLNAAQNGPHSAGGDERTNYV